MLAAVLNHDGQQRSAIQTRSHALADADHLAVLHAIWTAETAPAREQRYRDLLLAALPPGYRAEPGHRARWLWRTLRAAELAGLDPAQVLAEAIAERDLAGSREVSPGSAEPIGSRIIIQGELSVSTPRQRRCSHVFYGLVLVQAVHVTTKEPACDIDSSPQRWQREPHSPCSPAPPWRRRRPGR